MGKIGVLLAINNAVFSYGLTFFLTTNLQMECFEADNSDMAFNAYKKIQPDLVIVDYDLKPMNGKTFIIQLLKAFPDAKAIGLSSSHANYYLRDFQEAGAKGFIWRDINHDDLIYIIRQVLKGRIVFPAKEKQFRHRPG